MPTLQEVERRFSYRTRASLVLVGVTTLAYLNTQLTGRDGLPDSLSWLPRVVLVGEVLLGILLMASHREVDGHRQWAAALPGEANVAWHVVVRWVWLVLAAASVVGLAADASMPAGAPAIVRIELEATAPDPQYYDSLRDSLVGDLWFIAAYVTLLVLLAVWCGAYFRLGGVRRLRRPCAYAVLAAGVIDLLEDAMLWWGTHANSTLPWQAATVAAWAKFAILATAVLYILGGAHAWLSTPPWVRRRAWSLTGDVAKMTPGAVPAATESKLGIALSGGGIRAASITLGALQCLELDRRAPGKGLGWPTASKVTAISGGSNMAAGWSITRSTYAFEERPGGPKAGCASRVPPGDLELQPWAYYETKGQYAGDLTPEEKHLCNNLGYLASTTPRGATDDPANTAVQSGPRTGSSPAQSTAHAERVVQKQASRPSAYATVFAGMAVNAGVLLGALFVLARPVGWSMQSLSGGVLEPDGIHRFVSDNRLGVVGPIYLGLGVVLLLVWVLVGQLWAQRVGQPGEAAGRRQQQLLSALKWGTYGALIMGAALSLLLWVLPELAGLASRVNVTVSSLASLASAAGVLGAVVRILRKPATRYAPAIGGVAFGALLFFLAALWIGAAATEPITTSWSTWNSVPRWAAIAAALALLQVFVSPEKWSLAAFYRGKLRLAYATYRMAVDGDAPRSTVEVYRNDTATSVAAEREPYLHAFVSRAATQPASGIITTPLVVCATATITTRAVRTHHGIPALSVTFDPDACTVFVPHDDRGAWSEYKAPTRVINALGTRHGKRVTTMLAAAVSSAAVSPAMGRFRVGPTSMLLAFANLRLGVWLPNPRYAEGLDANVEEPSFPRTGLGYLIKEFLGIHDLTDPYLYVTDGGHWENTGLVELLRDPSIREVVCIDADAGPGDALSSLGKALELAPMECDVRVWIDLDPMRAKPAGSEHSPAYAARTVNLGFFTRGRDVKDSGVVWYAKPGLTAEMPQNLLAFRETHADFPHVSTLNQFFDTASFQAYRDLGRFNARQILVARKALTKLLADLEPLPTAGEIDAHLDLAIAKGDTHWVAAEFRGALGRREPDAWHDFVVTIRQVLAAQS